MKPLPVTAKVLAVKDLLVTDMAFAAEQYSQVHEHELPFVGVVLGGSLRKWLGRLSVDMTAADAYVMPGGVSHIDGFPVGVRILTLELDPETETWEPCADLLKRVRRLRGPELTTIARQIARELQAPDDVTTIAVEGLSLELVAGASRALTEASGRPRAPTWLNTVDEFLIASFSKPLRIAEVAAIVHVHPAHLARVFRRHHGETIGHRIRRLRLDWAIGQLVEGDRPLREIAAAAGFAHQSHFTRAFKEHTGWPPAQYRERQRNAA